jgi:hypothetical protein
VREPNGGKAEVVGITEHFDDADLQQFVNGKTNRTVRFAYETFNHEGKGVGILKFTAQTRPVCLRNDYMNGMLRKNVAYVRQGSSTVEASPDEMIEMALMASDTKPVIELEFGDAENQQMLGSSICLRPVIRPVLALRHLMPKTSRPQRDYFDAIGDGAVADARRIVQDYLIQKSATVEAVLAIRNSSSTLATSVQVDFRLEKQDGLTIADEPPRSPRRDRRDIDHNDLLPVRLKVRETKDAWFIDARFGKIRPGETVFCPGLHLAAAQDISLQFDARVLSEEQLPQSFNMKIEIARVQGPAFTIPEIDEP